MNNVKVSISPEQIAEITFVEGDGASSKDAMVLYREFAAAVRQVVSLGHAVIGVYISSERADFLGASDGGISLRSAVSQAADPLQYLVDLKAPLRQLESMGIPVVIGITGQALGPAFEIALAAHYRIGLLATDIRLGLNDVNMGITPVLGGITRLAHTIGLQGAMAAINQGTAYTVEKALKAGLIDDLATRHEDVRTKAVNFILKFQPAEGADKPQPCRARWDVVTTPLLKHDDTAILAIGASMVMSATKMVYPVPVATVCCVRDIGLVDFDTAAVIEARYVLSALRSAPAINMSTAFGRQLPALSSRHVPDTDMPRPVRTVGIVGAGLMGNGIAVLAALNGFNVVVKSSSPDGLKRGIKERSSLLSGMRRIKESEREMAQHRISQGIEWDVLSRCDLVIESVPESTATKLEVIRAIAAVVPPAAVIATNTSGLSIEQLSAADSDPSRFIGMHFFTPATKMPLIEVIAHSGTKRDVIETALALARAMGKTAIAVNDAPDFFTTRVIATFIAEASRMVIEGVDPARIENAALLNGSPMGPLAVMDEIGIDTGYKNAQQVHADSQAKGLPVPNEELYVLLSALVQAGERYGKRVSAGFYDYRGDGIKTLWEGLGRWRPEDGYLPVPFQDIRDRLVFIQCIEALHAFREGVIGTQEEANIGSIMGIGFPAHTGGVFQFILSYGVDAFCARSAYLADQYGVRFQGVSRDEILSIAGRHLAVA